MLLHLKRKVMLNVLNTIAAISTASGVGGIGVVRVSGPKSQDILKKICSIVAQPRQAHFVNFKNKEGDILDQGLVLFFPGPNSFTGEDVVEFQGHGGPVVLNSILNACLSLGASLAQPGEFTQRAYLNNKIDLVQAESVIDLINASTEQAAKSAINSLSGNFSNKINDLLKKLIELRMYIEACLDFPEEDIDFISEGKVKEKLQALSKTMMEILNAATQGQLLRDGINIVLVGQPNVGKSSLLNQLSGEDRAIVTEIPGTTRDAISSEINLEGVPLHVVDTAGLRETDDVVEKFGIDRTWASLEKAHIALFMVEASSGIAKYEKFILGRLPAGIKKIWIFNKVDLLNEPARKEISNGETIIYLSAKYGDGLELLKTHILNIVGKSQSLESSQDLFAARARHLEALNFVNEALKNSLLKLDSSELVAEELTLAQKALSTITGEFSSDDLLGEIFSQFCIGK
jgi:tRNA modification GTPase